jgi:hypothetical protein
MKKITLLPISVVALLLFSFSFIKGPIFMPDSFQYRFETVAQGTTVNGKMPYKNTGVDPLIITKVEGSIPAITGYTKLSTIAPGQSDTLFFAIDTKTLKGAINKTINIRNNGQKGISYIQLIGNITVAK